MTDPEALALAKRIASCWRGGTPLVDWIAELTPLDHQHATTTYERLRRLLEAAPTIPRFLTEYRAITATNVTQITPWTPADKRMTRAEITALLVKSGAPPRLIGKRTDAP